MTPGIKPLVAGNWKMNGTAAMVGEFEKISSSYNGELQSRIDILICPPATLLARLVASASNGAKVGGQDCHANETGAHTGDTSAEMIADAGGSHVIVGHSERRTDHGESSAMVNAKAKAVYRAGLTAIICIGETGSERESGKTLDVLGEQLAGSIPNEANSGDTVIAYEPVWAIGTGKTPSADDVEEVHKFIRDTLVARFGEAGKSFKLQYGGSVKPGNAAELMAIANVDGALIGGASLKADDFLAICEAYRSINA